MAKQEKLTAREAKIVGQRKSINRQLAQLRIEREHTRDYRRKKALEDKIRRLTRKLERLPQIYDD